MILSEFANNLCFLLIWYWLLKHVLFSCYHHQRGGWAIWALEIISNIISLSAFYPDNTTFSFFVIFHFLWIFILIRICQNASIIKSGIDSGSQGWTYCNPSAVSHSCPIRRKPLVPFPNFRILAMEPQARIYYLFNYIIHLNIRWAII